MVREIGLDAGLVDVKVCAVTDVWSGLKFVRRVKDRKTRLKIDKPDDGQALHAARREPVSSSGQGRPAKNLRRSLTP